MQFTIFADGGSRGNPGPAGSGAVVYDAQGAIVAEVSEFIGQTTNNVAEYTALIRGLEALAEYLDERTPSASVVVKMDSELAVKQMRGEYKVKHPNLKPLAEQAHQRTKLFSTVSFVHVPREQNKAADALANAAMDRGA